MTLDQLPRELTGCTLVDRPIDDDAIAELAQADRQRLAPRGNASRMCRSKKSYGRRAALRAARILRDRQGEDVAAYTCPHCDRYHVGHRPVAR